MARKARGSQGLKPSGRVIPEMAFDPIKAALRQIHDNIAAEGIPDDFADLLDRLDNSSTNRKPN